MIERAYVYSAKVHQGQIRLSGEPYLSHLLESAYILTQMKMEVVTVAAGLLSMSATLRFLMLAGASGISVRRSAMVPSALYVIS